MIYPPDGQFCREHGGRLRDPFGQQWMMRQHIEDVSAEEMSRWAAALFGKWRSALAGKPTGPAEAKGRSPPHLND